MHEEDCQANTSSSNSCFKCSIQGRGFYIHVFIYFFPYNYHLQCWWIKMNTYGSKNKILFQRYKFFPAFRRQIYQVKSRDIQILFNNNLLPSCSTIHSVFNKKDILQGENKNKFTGVLCEGMLIPVYVPRALHSWFVHSLKSIVLTYHLKHINYNKSSKIKTFSH